MARRKRASIKGRGAAILFGEKASPEKIMPELTREKVDIEELLGEEAELVAPELDADLEKAFGEEVTAMEPTPPTPVTPVEEPVPPKAPEVVSPPPEVSPTPVTPAAEPMPPKTTEVVSPPLEVPPSSEPRRVSVTLRVEEPSPPPTVPAPKVEEAPPTPTYPPVTPPPPEMPARRWEEPAYGPPPYLPESGPPPDAVYEPPPYIPESVSEAAPAVPSGRPLVSPYDRPPPEIKPGGYLVDHPVDAGEEAGLPTGVVPRREERVEAERAEEIPPQLSREISERTVLGRVGEKRQSDLLNEIDILFVETARILSVDKGLEEALALLRDARDILIERPRQFDEAEYLVAKVRARLARKQNIAQWSLIYGYPVLLYEVVWFVLFLSSLLFDHALAVFIANMTGMTFADLASLSMEHIFPLWNTMAWGGIGGVVGALYSLYWHAAVEQDFDKQYIMWYIVQPIMGIILGGIVYLVIAAGFISIQVLAAQAADFGEAAQAMTNPAIKAFHSVVACIAGFRQRFVYEMLDKIVQVLTPKPKTKAELEAEIKKEETG